MLRKSYGMNSNRSHFGSSTRTGATHALVPVVLGHAGLGARLTRTQAAASLEVLLRTRKVTEVHEGVALEPQS